jgi:hypothetical protein
MFKCPLCQRVFNKWNGLKVHFNVVHQVYGEGFCFLCNKRFKDRRHHIFERAKQRDLKYMIIYGLLSRSNHPQKEANERFRRKCEKLAMFYLKLKER